MARFTQSVTMLLFVLLMFDNSVLRIIGNPINHSHLQKYDKLGQVLATADTEPKEDCKGLLCGINYEQVNLEQVSIPEQQPPLTAPARETILSGLDNSTHMGESKVKIDHTVPLSGHKLQNFKPHGQDLKNSSYFKPQNDKVNVMDAASGSAGKSLVNNSSGEVQQEGNSISDNHKNQDFSQKNQEKSNRAGRHRRWVDEESDLRARQVDPVHSCIEAKCAGAGGHNYMDCIFRQCIASINGRLVQKRSPADFRVSYRNFNPRYRMAQKEKFNGLSKISNDDREYSREILENQMDDKDGSVDDNMMASSYSRMLEDKDGLEAENKVQKRVDKILEVRRAFNDITDLCVKHDCGPAEHTVQYFRCKHQCTLKRP